MSLIISMNLPRIQDIQDFYPEKVDPDLLLNIVNELCKKEEIFRPIPSKEGEIKIEVTEKGIKARKKHTRSVLRRIDRDFRKKEMEGSVHIQEVGLGGQVVNSYTTSKKSLLWTAILCPVLIAVVIIIILLTK